MNFGQISVLKKKNQNSLSDSASLWLWEVVDGGWHWRPWPKNLIWKDQIANLADLQWRLIQMIAI